MPQQSKNNLEFTLYGNAGGCITGFSVQGAIFILPKITTERKIIRKRNLNREGRWNWWQLGEANDPFGSDFFCWQIFFSNEVWTWCLLIVGLFLQSPFGYSFFPYKSAMLLDHGKMWTGSLPKISEEKRISDIQRYPLTVRVGFKWIDWSQVFFLP